MGEVGRQLTAKQMEMGKMVAAGASPIDAYEAVYRVSRKVAGQSAARAMRMEAMQQFTERLIARTRKEVLPLREEVRNFLVSTMRDGGMAMEHRLRAARQLCDLEGFNTKQVASADEEEVRWRATLVAEMRREPLVKGIEPAKAVDV